MSIYLSLVIPVFNEEEIIKKNLDVVTRFLKKLGKSYEIIVVDDGSSDSTVKIVEGIEDKNVKLIMLRQNRGKGAALRAGVAKASGKYILFSDADLSVPIEFLDEIIKKLQMHEVAVASRRVQGAVIKTHQPPLRELMGRVFTKLTQLLIQSGIADFTCGFKGFTYESGKKLFSQSRIDRWAYDAEIIFLAHKYGYKIAQVPVVWENRVDTRVKMGRAAVESFFDVLRVRVWELMGKYES